MNILKTPQGGSILPSPSLSLRPRKVTSSEVILESDNSKPVTDDQLNSLTASATRLLADANRVKNSGVANRNNATSSSWQGEAWDMYDLVGELHFIVNVISSQLAKAELKVQYRNDEGILEDVDDPNDPAVQLLSTLSSGVSGLSTLLHRWALNLQISGEAYLVGIPAKDPETNERPSLANATVEEVEWHILSVSEVSRKEDEVTLTLDSNDLVTLTLDNVFLIRVHRPHPRKKWEADSPVRASLPILKELVGLTMHVSAQVDSRLAGAGILTIPQGVQNSLREQALASGSISPGTTPDLFTEQLVRAMVTPIADRASASAVAPLVMTIPDEAMGKIQHISFAGQLDGQAKELREEAIRRLALSLDTPPEVLLGTGDMNHWSSWLIREDTVTSHITPLLSIMTEAITEQFLYALLGNGEDSDSIDVSRYEIVAEVDQLISRPNLSTDAQQLADRGLISDKATRRATGFNESDAENPAHIKVLKLIEDNPSLITSPGIPALIDSVEALLEGRTPDNLAESLEVTDSSNVSDNSDKPTEKGSQDNSEDASNSRGGSSVNDVTVPDSLQKEVTVNARS